MDFLLRTPSESIGFSLIKTYFASFSRSINELNKNILLTGYVLQLLFCFAIYSAKQLHHICDFSHKATLSHKLLIQFQRSITFFRYPTNNVFLHFF